MVCWPIAIEALPPVAFALSPNAVIFVLVDELREITSELVLDNEVLNAETVKDKFEILLVVDVLNDAIAL